MSDDIIIVVKIISSFGYVIPITKLGPKICLIFNNNVFGSIAVYFRNIIIGLNYPGSTNFIQLNNYLYEYNNRDELKQKLKILNINPETIFYFVSIDAQFINFISSHNLISA